MCHVWVYFPVYKVIVGGRTVGNSFFSHSCLFWVGVCERIISQIIREVNYALPSRFISIQMLCLTGFTLAFRLTTALGLLKAEISGDIPSAYPGWIFLELSRIFYKRRHVHTFSPAATPFFLCTEIT